METGQKDEVSRLEMPWFCIYNNPGRSLGVKAYFRMLGYIYIYNTLLAVKGTTCFNDFEGKARKYSPPPSSKYNTKGGIKI